MKVYESGSFSGSHKRYERAGKKIVLGTRFSYGDCEWVIPAAYSCRESLVMDVFRLIPEEKLRSFAERWYDRLKGDPAGEGLTEEERLLAEAENPLSDSPRFEAQINGAEASGTGWCGTGWQRIWKSESDWDRETETELLSEYAAYGLREAAGWYCYRLRFLWPGGKRRIVRDISLTIEAGRVEYSCGSHFTTKTGCDPFETEFFHPVTGSRHVLRIVSCAEPDEARRPEEHKMRCTRMGMIFPENFHILHYTVHPPLPKGDRLRILDLAKGDSPIRKGRKQSGAAAVGIIGGASGVTLIETGRREDPAETAFSALHFEPVSSVEWYTSVSVCPFGPMTVKIKTEGDTT